MIWTEFYGFNSDSKFEGFIFHQRSDQFTDLIEFENVFSIFGRELEVVVTSTNAMPIVN